LPNPEEIYGNKWGKGEYIQRNELHKQTTRKENQKETRRKKKQRKPRDPKPMTQTIFENTKTN